MHKKHHFFGIRSYKIPVHPLGKNAALQTPPAEGACKDCLQHHNPAAHLLRVRVKGVRLIGGFIHVAHSQLVAALADRYDGVLQ